MPRLPWRRGGGEVSLRRQGGSPPPDWETLDITSDGTFRMWRTIARSTRPPTPVGRFGGVVPPERLVSVRAAAAACAKAEPVVVSPAPGAATDRVKLGSTVASWPDDHTPPEPWDQVAGVLRALLAELASSPVAAVAVVLGDDGGARLGHEGTEAIEVDLSAATVRAVRWEGGMAVGHWQSDVDGPRSVSAGPGWEHQLPFGHDHPPGSMVTAHVDNMLVFDGEFWRACSAQSDGT